MKYCNNCNVKYDTPSNKCLLCDRRLQFYDNKPTTYKFKTHKKEFDVLSVLYKIGILFNLVSIINVLYVNYVTNEGVLSWSLIVVTGNVYLILLMTILYKKYRWFSKLIMMTFLSAGSVLLVGFILKDYLWAINYVIPATIVTNLLALTFLLIIDRKKWFDYVASLLLVSGFGITSILMNILNLTSVKWPTIVAAFYSLATILTLLTFSNKKVLEEFKRKFHI